MKEKINKVSYYVKITCKVKCGKALFIVFLSVFFLRVKRIFIVPYFHHSFLFAVAVKKIMLLVVERIKKQYKETIDSVCNAINQSMTIIRE
ncbi:hypothetical protein [Bartonella harrusi]|uniref:Uncharacterized protein n=1 Tax=Bartonella harrusi TaxID=2961895 RepID=A0ABY5ES70_9HYPH|nr:hypothetical protein [Bartonella harrusi]UTO27969.1 hypothetical protein NMK50_07000 [Bartonella harrusi]